MTIRLAKITFAIIFACHAGLVFADDAEIQSLRTAIEQLRADYESRITELERRLAVAEQNASQASYAAGQAAAAPVGAANASRSAFNPAMGIIFQGQAWHYDKNPSDYAVAGFPYGGEAGPFDRGLAIGETELSFSANVDDKFTAWLTTPVSIENGEATIGVEEAWLETTALPAGFAARFGRFYSGIGYLNSKHAHSWDFADQPLPYQAFLANQYGDDGVQLRWIAPTDFYMELGGEVLQGGGYPAAGATHSGFGSHSLFVNVGGDVGADSSWLAGVSWLDVSAADRASGSGADPYLFNGDSSLVVANVVWKWTPNGNWKQRNLVIQSEYLWRNEDGFYTLPDDPGAAYNVDQRGWYVQAVYQPFPRWRFGGRLDGLSGDNPGAAFDNTWLSPRDGDPRRYSLMADWSNSEFSRLRLQFTRDQAGLGTDNQWGLQYIYSIGAHGAHAF